MAYTFSATSELYHDGYNDDGTKTIKELYFITATSHYGEVYAYTGDLTGRDIDRVIEGFTRRVTADWEPSEQYWNFVRYVYGSKAYTDNYFEAETSLMDKAEFDNMIKAY
jgi:hypothetical protein